MIKSSNSERHPMNPSLQARIAAVDWASKGVPDVPRWLNDLLSDNNEVAHTASNILDENIVQGNIDWQDFDLGYDIEGVLRTDAPDLLVDFLIELLKEAQSPGLSYILNLLVGQRTYVRFKFINEGLKSRALNIYDKIWSARTLYIPLLGHTDDKVRQRTVSLLCGFRDQPDTVIALILDAISAERDPYTVLSYLQEFTMYFLERKRIDEAYDNAYFSLLNDLLVSPLGLAVQTVAAYHLIEQLGADMPENALNKLVAGMIVEFDHDITSGIMAARVDVQSRILMKLPLDRAITLYLQVLKQTLVIKNALIVFVDALTLACEPPVLDINAFFLQPIMRDGIEFHTYSISRFTLPPKYDLAALTNRQKRVIQAAVENDLIWTVATNIFDLFGLPSNRDVLRTLMA
ncbi:MAG: hypothetical protein ABI690_07845 [Chloroflexota bacterium]